MKGETDTKNDQKRSFPTQKQSELLLALFCKSAYIFVSCNKQTPLHISTSVLAFYVTNHCFSAKETSAEVTFVRNAEVQLPPILHALDTISA